MEKLDDDFKAIYVLMSIAYTPTREKAWAKCGNSVRDLWAKSANLTLKYKYKRNLTKEEREKVIEEVFSKLFSLDFGNNYDKDLESLKDVIKKFKDRLIENIEFDKYSKELAYVKVFERLNPECYGENAVKLYSVDFDLGTPLKKIAGDLGKEKTVARLGLGWKAFGVFSGSAKFPKMAISWVESCAGVFSGYVSSSCREDICIVIPTFIYETICEKLRPEIKEVMEIFETKSKFSFIFEEEEEEENVHEKLQYVIGTHPELVEAGLKILDEEVETPMGRIDLLGEDKDGNLVVIEIKTGKPEEKALNQCLRYMRWVKENLAKSDQDIRGIIVGEENNKYLSYTADMIPNLEIRIIPRKSWKTLFKSKV